MITNRDSASINLKNTLPFRRSGQWSRTTLIKILVSSSVQLRLLFLFSLHFFFGSALVPFSLSSSLVFGVDSKSDTISRCYEEPVKLDLKPGKVQLNPLRITFNSLSLAILSSHVMCSFNGCHITGVAKIPRRFTKLKYILFTLVLQNSYLFQSYFNLSPEVD